MSDQLLQGYLSLSRNINKVEDSYKSEHQEGVVSELTDELKLSMSDDELIKLKKDWEAAWDSTQKMLAESQNDNESYWLGKQYNNETSTQSHPLVDNIIFESLETFLPLATRPKADPIVSGDGTREGQELADKVRKMLQYWEENNSFNIKLKQVARYWALYKLGCIKLGWSIQKNDIVATAIRPQKLILDPDATIDSGEYTGEYIGEYRKESARNLIKRFPNSKKYIEDTCKGKLGTKMQYIEWWTDDYVFWTMDNEVLAKARNPHWNYEKTTIETDAYGIQNTVKIEGKNHFKFPKKPYAFMSVFSLGVHPFDDTNLIQQTLPLQDLINKRLRQIDKNADKTNGGLAVSGDSFTKEQAAGVAKATEKGGTIFVPNGDVNRAVARLTAPPLPNFVYESLIDYRNELRNIFGVRGSTAQGTIQDKTVRGKMQIKGQDSDRVGGGISTYLEQLSDVVFNYITQMMYVYYDEEHVATLVGKNNSREYISLTSRDFICALTVGVKDGSMIPKDPVTQREEVMNLWQLGAIDPITFFEKLDFPDPVETAKQLYLWKADPISLFPDLAQKQQQEMMMQQQLQQEQGNNNNELEAQKKQQEMEIERQKAEQDMQNSAQKHQLEMLKQQQEIYQRSAG